MKISVEQLKQLNKEEYILIDIRDAEEAFKNPIENSIVLSGESVLSKEFDSTKKIIVVCAQGYVSDIVAQRLQEKYEAYSVDGGYVSIVMDKMNTNVSDDFCAQVERSIIKTYRRKIWSKFTKAIRDYELVKEGDCIAVCISGGKDSMLMAKCFQELHKHSPVPFDVKYIVMDPGYSKENRDVIETILMSMLYGGQIQTMMPKLHSNNFKGMEVIRPLYLIHEDDIKAWAKHNNLYFIQCACKFTQACANETCLTQSKSKRLEMKNLIKELKKVNPFVEQNIFKSVENVSLKTVIAYKDDHARHHFLDTYDEEGNE